MARERHVLEARVESGLVLPRDVFPKGGASRHILENRELCQQYHGLYATSVMTHVRKLTAVTYESEGESRCTTQRSHSF